MIHHSYPRGNYHVQTSQTSVTFLYVVFSVGHGEDMPWIFRKCAVRGEGLKIVYTVSKSPQQKAWFLVKTIKKILTFLNTIINLSPNNRNSSYLQTQPLISRSHTTQEETLLSSFPLLYRKPLHKCTEAPPEASPKCCRCIQACMQSFLPSGGWTGQGTGKRGRACN